MALVLKLAEYREWDQQYEKDIEETRELEEKQTNRADNLKILKADIRVLAKDPAQAEQLARKNTKLAASEKKLADKTKELQEHYDATHTTGLEIETQKVLWAYWKKQLEAKAAEGAGELPAASEPAAASGAHAAASEPAAASGAHAAASEPAAASGAHAAGSSYAAAAAAASRVSDDDIDPSGGRGRASRGRGGSRGAGSRGGASHRPIHDDSPLQGEAMSTAEVHEMPADRLQHPITDSRSLTEEKDEMLANLIDNNKSRPADLLKYANAEKIALQAGWYLNSMLDLFRHTKVGTFNGHANNVFFKNAANNLFSAIKAEFPRTVEAKKQEDQIKALMWADHKHIAVLLRLNGMNVPQPLALG